MPPEKHAKLSASSAHRWMNCTPSANLEREFADKSSEAAAEGTAAHALCEHKLRKALKLPSTRPVSKYDSDDMEMYCRSLEANNFGDRLCPFYKTDAQNETEQKAAISQLIAKNRQDLILKYYRSKKGGADNGC